MLSTFLRLGSLAAIHLYICEPLGASGQSALELLVVRCCLQKRLEEADGLPQGGLGLILRPNLAGNASHSAIGLGQFSLKGGVSATFLDKGLVILKRRFQKFGPQRLQARLIEELIFAYFGQVRINGFIRFLADPAAHIPPPPPPPP